MDDISIKQIKIKIPSSLQITYECSGRINKGACDACKLRYKCFTECLDSDIIEVNLAELIRPLLINLIWGDAAYKLFKEDDD